MIASGIKHYGLPQRDPATRGADRRRHYVAAVAAAEIGSSDTEVSFAMCKRVNTCTFVLKRALENKAMLFTESAITDAKRRGESAPVGSSLNIREMYLITGPVCIFRVSTK